MPFLPVFGAVQVVLVHDLDGSISTTAPIFLDRGLVVSADPVALAAAVDSWWRSSVLPLLSVNLHYIRYEWQRLDAPGLPVTATPHVPPINGGMGGNCHPANVSVRVNARIAPTSFAAPGCLFVPGIPHFATSGNTIERGWRASVEAAYNELIGAAEAVEWVWIVAQKFSHRHLLFAAGRHPVVRAAIESPWVAQRRSRLHNEPLP